MKHWSKNKYAGFIGTSLAVVVLSGCSSFTGILTPQYDGQPVVVDQEAIDLYNESNEIAADYESLYYRYPLSESLFEPSLIFEGGEPVILEQGSYTVGTDVPEGRVYLEGESSDFRQDRWIIHTGNMKISDEEGAGVFENHFQDGTGVLQAVVDLKEGHTIDITGNDPIITLYYEDRLNQENTITSDETVQLIAGHYEVGEHFDAGTFSVSSIQAPRTTELYLFKANGEQIVMELSFQRITEFGLTMAENEELFNLGIISETEYAFNMEQIEQASAIQSTFELEDGDKIYLPMVNQLILERR